MTDSEKIYRYWLKRFNRPGRDAHDRALLETMYRRFGIPEGFSFDVFEKKALQLVGPYKGRETVEPHMAAERDNQ